MSSAVFWVTCLSPETIGLFPGTKVHLSQCLACSVADCQRKGEVIARSFPPLIPLERSGLNRKIIELNEKLDAARKKTDLYCPRKGNLTTKCVGLSTFCRYNLICGRFKDRTGRSFIRSMRWRKIMVYVVKFKDGTIRQIEKSELAGIDIDRVEVVYPGTLEIEVVTELVPQGEEQERLEGTIASFEEKYHANVVCEKGLIDFAAWFTNAATGDRAIVPERALVPLKTYRVVKIKGASRFTPPKQSPLPTELTPAPTKVKEPAAPKKIEKTEPPRKEKTPPPAKRSEPPRKEKTPPKATVKKPIAPLKKGRKKK